MKKQLLIFVLFFLVIGIVLGVQPSITTQTSPTGTLTLVYPKNPFFEQYANEKIHVHIFNSTGQPQTSANIAFCTFHLYNRTGSHIIEQNMSWDSNGIELSFTLNSTFTQEKRVLPYILWCVGNAGTESGFVSSDIVIGSADSYYKDSIAILPVVLLGIMVIFIYMFIALNWKTEDKKPSIIKLFLGLFIVWLVPLIIAFMTQIATNAFFSAATLNLIDTFYAATMWINITFSLIVGIYLFYNLLLYLGVSFNRGGR